MRYHRPLSMIVLLVLAVWCDRQPVFGQGDVPPQPEILAQGPVHEAFALPSGVGSIQPGPIVSTQPPAPIEELPPDQRPDGANVQWIPGYWQWDDSRNDFIWVSGIWRDLPPGEQWVPGSWQQVPGGFQWVSGFWAPAQLNQLSYLPPPPASLDLGPSAPAPGADYFYDPGCWVYLNTGYRWRPGCWRRFRPGFAWTPACYNWTPAGCVFNDGYWDYPLASRGCLFAPCWFPRRRLGGWGGSWTPQYAVAPGLLPSMLFAGPGGRGYFFGNYYGPGYRRAGFAPWFDNRAARWGGDPLFAHYRHNLGGGWERDLKGLYAGRASGRLTPLPATLAQQTTAITRLQGQNVRNVSVLAPLAGLSRQGVALTRINQSERVRQARGAAQLQVTARQRLGLGRGMVLRGAAPQSIRSRPTGPARVSGVPRSGRTFAPTIGAPRQGAPARFTYSGYGQGTKHFRSTPPRYATARPAQSAPRFKPGRPAATPRSAAARPRIARPIQTAPRTFAPKPAQQPRQFHAAVPRVQPRAQARPAAPVRRAQPHYAAPRPTQPHRAAQAPRPVQHASGHGHRK